MSKASKARKARAATKYAYYPLAQRRDWQKHWCYWKTVAMKGNVLEDIHTRVAREVWESIGGLKVYGTPILAEVSEALEALDKLKEQQ